MKCYCLYTICQSSPCQSNAFFFLEEKAQAHKVKGEKRGRKFFSFHGNRQEGSISIFPVSLPSIAFSSILKTKLVIFFSYSPFVVWESDLRKLNRVGLG